MLMSINVVILNCCCSYFVVIVWIMLMLANGFVGACNTKEKGDEKASVGNIFNIHLSFLACKRNILQDFIMLFAFV